MNDTTPIQTEARNPQDIEDALATFAKERVPAVMVAVDAVFFGQRWRIAELALLAARFKTIQVCPKDIGAHPGHAEPAISWHSGFREGSPCST
jgi:hypothetical protein